VQKKNNSKKKRKCNMSHENEADYVYESALQRARRQGYNEEAARRYAQDQVRSYWMGEGSGDEPDEDDRPRAA